MTTHVVVDGSNVATEGRKKPSLAQLREAVAQFVTERPADRVTVIVDATFPNRIDKSERAEYEQLVDDNEILTPPAGVIGRGDAFILQVADKAGAMVFSNDSFQEFHGEYGWLFEEGRLIGGKPVPGVGWVFVDRAPVRGPTSRKARRSAKPKAADKAKAKEPDKAEEADTGAAEDEQPSSAGKASGGSRSRRKRAAKKEPAKKAAARKRSPRKRAAAAKPADATPADDADIASEEGLNELLPFLEFVGAHPVGTLVEGEVERFASHGAYVSISGIRGYVPLKKLGEPAPTKARAVLERGEVREFVIDGVDTPRRGLDLALPGFGTAPVPGEGTDGDPERSGRHGARQPAEGSQMAPAKKKAAAKRAPAKKKAAAKKAPAKKRTVKKRAVKRAAPRR